MKAIEGVKIAVIGGTGLESLFRGIEAINVGTPYGFSYTIQIGEVNGKKIAFLPRHGERHEFPPHKVNYRANIYALYKIGVERIIATNAVGAINLSFKPGDLVIPHDLIDFTKHRQQTFYDYAPVKHVDFSEPYCPEIRRVLIETTRNFSNVHEKAVYVCTEGPRFETPAEIRMFRILGCDVVGMTGMPETALARELGMCYATLCFVSNMAAGIANKLSQEEVIEVSRNVLPKIQKIIAEAIKQLSEVKGCKCSSAIKH